jgi:hypothetical protein
MNVHTSTNLRRITLVKETLVGIAVTFALMLYGVMAYPASVSQTGLSDFLTSVAALLAYAGVAVWARQRSADSVQIALAQGARVGLLLGIIAVVNLSLEHFVALGAPLSAVRGVGMWGLIFLSFGAASSATYHKVGSLGLAILASVWSALVSTVGTLIFGFSINLLFMSHMQHILASAYAHSGMTDPRAFVIRNTLDAASSHLLLTPFVAVVFGFVGGYAGSILGSIRRGVAISLGVVDLLLLVAGPAAIRFALSLDRSERPPFIIAGLLSLGVALSCAPAVFRAIRRPAQQRGV